MTTITRQGIEIEISGNLPPIGTAAPSFSLAATDLADDPAHGGDLRLGVDRRGVHDVDQQVGLHDPGVQTLRHQLACQAHHRLRRNGSN